MSFLVNSVYFAMNSDGSFSFVTEWPVWISPEGQPVIARHNHEAVIN